MRLITPRNMATTILITAVMTMQTSVIVIVVIISRSSRVIILMTISVLTTTALSSAAERWVQQQGRLKPNLLRPEAPKLILAASLAALALQKTLKPKLPLQPEACCRPWTWRPAKRRSRSPTSTRTPGGGLFDVRGPFRVVMFQDPSAQHLC